MASPRTAGATFVGLDIEPGFIAAAQVRIGNDGLTVERSACAPLAPGVMRDGEVADAEALAEALRELFRANKLGKRVRVGVANQRIVVRIVDLPPLTDAKQIAAAVRFHAQDHIPMSLDQAVLEHQSLGLVDTAEGQRTRVVLVAARRDMVERFHTALRQAGLRPAGIDLSAFAMIRALHRDEPGATLYVSVAGMTNLALAEGTTCVFTRVVPGGVEALAAELAERRGLTLEHARGWLTHIGLSAALETIDGDPEIVSEGRRVLEEGVRRIADEVRNSLDYYRTQANALSADHAILTGSAVAIPGFAEELGAAIGLQMERGVVAEARPGVYGEVEGARMTVAAGLAIEQAVAAPRRAPVEEAVATPVEEPVPTPIEEPVPTPVEEEPVEATPSALVEEPEQSERPTETLGDAAEEPSA
jgi:type IV pilus assembly protein PilM